MTDVLGVLAQSGVDRAILGPAGVPVAFVLGIVSFFTPCILPLVPGYLSYMSGVSGQALAAGEQRRRVLVASLLFVAGFALVFTALGASASALGGFLLDRLTLVNRIAGAIVIVMGLAFLSTLAVRPMQRGRQSGAAIVRGASGAGLRFASIFARERSFHPKPGAGAVGAVTLGAAFAVGWSPCVGPALGTILTLAATENSVLRGATLLLSFSLGFGLWFVLGGLAFRRATAAFAVVRRYMAALTAVGGVFLVGIGVLLVTGHWARIIAPLQRFFVRFGV